MNLKSYFFLALIAASPLFADKAWLKAPPDSEPMWLTGPLFATSSLVTPVGTYNLEPYLYATAIKGGYDMDWNTKSTPTLWNYVFEFYTVVGLTEWLDFQAIPSAAYNYCKGAHSWVLNDLPLGFDIQLYQNPRPYDTWAPNVKLFLKETFPTGKYQKLNPGNKGTDAGGAGSFNTALGIAFGKAFYFGHHHFLSLRLSGQYSIPAPVDVEGLNAYGGAAGAKGTVYPMRNFELDFGLEFTFTQNWAFALDVIGNWWHTGRFKGNPGTLPDGTPGKIDVQAAMQWSAAPALEYNWSDKIGLIGGVWFTFLGKNSDNFISGVIAFNYYN